MKKLTLEYVKQKSLEIGFEFLDDFYNGSLYRHNFKCLKHGTVQKSVFSNINRDILPRCCGSEKISQGNRLELKEIKRRFKFFDFEFLDDHYENYRNKYNIKCLKHNEIFKACIQQIFQGHGLKCCKLYNSNRKDVKKSLLEKGYILLSPYIKSTDPVMIKCIKHGEVHYAKTQCILNLNSNLRCCWIDGISGKNNYRYNPKLTDDERVNRRLYFHNEVSKWRTQVYQRDKYTCACCYKIGGQINAHHIANWADNIKIRFEISNGVTLCLSCHKKLHSIYGKRNTTKKQFEEFLRNSIPIF